jgi:uncharacterized protein YjbI with pentapeptide repeats
MKKLLVLLFLSISLTGISYAGEVKTNAKKLKALNACPQCRLIGANLKDASLRWADLRGADLRGVNFINADLRGADLGGANLSRATLYGAKLSGINLKGAILCNTKTPWGIDNTGC